MIKVKNSMQVMRGWTARYAPWVGLASILGAVEPASAGAYEGSPQVAEFVGEMTRDYGFAGEQLMSVFREAERKQAILDAISRPAERVKQWKEYRPMFITDARIARGVDFWRQHRRCWPGLNRSTEYRPRSSCRSSASRPFSGVIRAIIG